MRKQVNSCGFTPREWDAYRRGGDAAVRNLRQKMAETASKAARPAPVARKVSHKEFFQRLAAMPMGELTTMVSELSAMARTGDFRSRNWLRKLRDGALALLNERREQAAVTANAA